MQRDQLSAAGEAIYASDLWRGTGALIGGVLMQSGALFISLVMLRGSDFAKATAFVGILTHGIDVLHVLLIPLLPDVAGMLMAVGGTLYLVWFPLIARDLIRLNIQSKLRASSSLLGATVE